MQNLRKGAIGALLDEYERAILDLCKVVKSLPDAILTTTIDATSTDENCRSVQAILTHVLYAGYGYATSIHNVKGPARSRPDKKIHITVSNYLKDLADLFSFTMDIFKTIEDNEIEQFDTSLKIKTGWGQTYDIEQLTEHAIVHILRHRRQIEKIFTDKFNQDAEPTSN